MSRGECRRPSGAHGGREESKSGTTGSQSRGDVGYPPLPMPTPLLALCLLVPQQSPAAPPREPAEIVRAVMDEALGSEHAYDTLTALVAAAPHRLAGSDGAAKAVAWAKTRMETEGLENVRLEPCTVPVWVRGTVASLTLQ